MVASPDLNPSAQVAYYGVPLAVWLTLAASVVVAVVSAATAIVVMWRSNVNSRRILREQLERGAEQFGRQMEHDARQRGLEREMSLRRDVYLPVADAIVRIQAALGQLTDIRADQLAIGRRVAIDLGALAKTHLVASESTLRAVMKYQKALMPAYLELIMLRGPLVVKRTGMEDHQKYIDRADAELQRIVQLMKQHNISGNTDRAAFDRLVAQSEIEQKTRKGHSDKQLALHKEMALGQIALAETMGVLAVKIANLIPDAIISCRQELGLPIDQAEYRKLYAEQQEAALEMMREAARRGREFMAASDSAPADSN